MDLEVPVVPLVSVAPVVPVVFMSVVEFMLFGMAPPWVGRSIGPVVPTPRGPAGLGLVGPCDGDTADVLPLFIVPELVPIGEVPVVCEPAFGPLLTVLLLGVPEAPPWARATLPQASAAAAASVVTMFDVRSMSFSY